MPGKLRSSAGRLISRLMSPPIAAAHPVTASITTGTAALAVAAAVLAGLTGGIALARPAAAATYPPYGTVMIAGPTWLQGMGQPVISNYQHWSGGTYQCDELAVRLYARLGWPAVRTAGNGGAAYIPEGSPGLVRHNPGTGYVPAPGDLMIESPRTGNPYGHVSVVDTVVGATINAVEQNGTATGRHVYTLGAHGAVSGGYSPVKAVMHAPSSGFDLRGGIRTQGDWDGNGTVTPGVVYRTADGLQWQLRNTNSAGPADVVFVYGRSTDVPVVGNWDARGGDTVGVARRLRTGGLQWLLRNGNSAGTPSLIFNYGASTDQPVVGNWDGVAGDGIGVVRRSAAGGPQWLLRNAAWAGLASYAFAYGKPGDYPVVGNWDARGGDSIGVVRRGATSLRWLLRNADSAGAVSVDTTYGVAEAYPVTGNWDGRGSDTIGVTAPGGSGSTTWLLRDAVTPGSPTASFGFGDAGRAYVG